MRTPLRDNRAVAAALAAVVTFGVSACGDDSAIPEDGADIEEIQEGEVEPDDEGPVEVEVFEDGEASAYVGEEVTVSGEVTKVFSRQAFHLTDNTSSDPLLVLDARDALEDPSAVEEGQVVRVTGTVHQVTPGALELFGDPEWLQSEWYDTAWDGGHAVFLDDVSTVDTDSG